MPRRKTSRTKEMMEQAFLELLSEKSYRELSIANICKRVGVANSSFYTYYKSKESLFQELLDRAARSIIRLMDDYLKGIGPILTLRTSMWRLPSILREDRTFILYRAFRELEFIDTYLARQFYQRLIEELSKIIHTGLDQNTFRGDIKPEIASTIFLGGPVFLFMHSQIWNDIKPDPRIADEMATLYLRGISCPREDGLSILDKAGSLNPVKVPSIEEFFEESKSGKRGRGEHTRSLLLSSALKLFSRQGYYATHISDITRDAGVAVGTFYKYYRAKNDILDDLVERIGRFLRWFLSERTSGLSDRRLVEVEGLRSFLSFIQSYSSIYKIVREAESIDPEIAHKYYYAFLEGYTESLKHAIRSGGFRDTIPEAASLYLIGANHMLGLYLSFLGDHSVSFADFVRGAALIILSGVELP